MSKKRIIIVGGGFGGVKCAKALLKKLDREAAEIVLFNTENHLVFSPLLAEVVGSSINSLDIVVPLRQLLPKIYCRTEEVQTVYLEENQVEYLCDSGDPVRMPYDHLVLACGNVTNLNVVPGMADHAFPLKTVADATTLRSHIMEQMERAEVSDNPEHKKWLLTFIVVGGGFSGAEVAGEINDLVKGSARYFRNFVREDVVVKLLHSRDEILPEISLRLREFARRKMEKAGVTFILNARVVQATADGVRLGDGQFIKGGTIICTIGNSSAPLLGRLKVPSEKGRLLTEPDMRIKGCANAWALGDCALVINALDNTPSPTTGQFAERQGKQCGKNILRVMAGEATRPFKFKQLGELCSIGGHSAVADLFGMHLSGFIAWFLWRGIYLFKLPTFARQLQVGFDWFWLLLFPRDLAHVRTRPTDRVSHAHYQTGDYIIRKGDAPINFYVIEEGEVEIVRETDDQKEPQGQEDVVAILGPGSFFGEKALMSDEPRVFSVRARSPLKVLVLGRNVFTQVSGALAPLRDALGQALNRRGINPWKNRPEVHELLKRTIVRSLMEPVPQPLLKPEATIGEVSRAFVDHGNEFFYVSSDGQTLEGIVTITDLLRARSSGAVEAPVKEFMTRGPIVIAADDSAVIASSAFREYRLKSLPVVEKKDGMKLLGCIRVRRLMAFIFKEVPPPGSSKPKGS
jgi:NADH dehydrogenase